MAGMDHEEQTKLIEQLGQSVADQTNPQLLRYVVVTVDQFGHVNYKTNATRDLAIKTLGSAIEGLENKTFEASD